MASDIWGKENDVCAGPIVGEIFSANSTSQFGEIIFGTQFVGNALLSRFLERIFE
jgi:hypothetical protein